MLQLVASYVTILAVYSVIILGLLILSKGQAIRNKWAIIFFMICVISYLIVDFVPLGSITMVLVAGPFLLPFSFWVFSKTMFSDEKLSIKAIVVYGLMVLVVYYGFYLIEPTASEISSQVIALILRAISMFFILMALYEAQRGSKVDLIEKRRKIRSIFIYTVSILVLLTLLVELGMPIKDHQLPKLLQRASMLIINTYFIVSLARLKGNFFGDEKKKSVPSNPELVDKIQNRVIEEKLYQTESLTIGQLAELLNEQEYKVRLTINQVLGYRNFTDFINSFRIEEARKTLTESSNDEITILEVAYKVGFNSIGPFNRAFKNITGLTPTEYRKKI